MSEKEAKTSRVMIECEICGGSFLHANPLRSLCSKCSPSKCRRCGCKFFKLSKYHTRCGRDTCNDRQTVYRYASTGRADKLTKPDY